MYLNGVLDGSGSSTETYTGTTPTISLIGARKQGASFVEIMKGYLDDVRIYNQALSQAEITQLYNLTTPDQTNKFTATAYDTPTNQGTDTVAIGAFPTTQTADATNVSYHSAQLNGTVNPNNNTATVWFDYGLSSGEYVGSSTTVQITGDIDTAINISLGALTKNTEYFFRLRGSNLIGETHGEEFSFSTTTEPESEQFVKFKRLMIKEINLLRNILEIEE
jgi:hypothetical protein